MRRVFLWVAGGATVALGLWACTRVTCEDTATCPGPGGQVTPGTGVNDGSAAVDGAVFPVGCEAAPSEDAKVLRDECGIFVQQGATGDGSKATPLGSVRDAVAKAAQQKKNRVYVCMGEYQEEVVIANAPVSIFGGLSCGDWTYDASKRPRVSTPAQGKYALKVEEARPVQISDMRFAARDGVTPGESSIAVFALNAKVTIRRTEIVGGQGAAGAPGSAPPVNARVGETGAMATSSVGANGTVCSNCALWGKSQGGRGGEAESDAGTATAGQGGTADPIAPPNGNKNGSGGVGYPGTNTACDPGREGAPGLARQGGAGASTSGTLSATGWTPMSGAAGEAGNPGQGGGGGGGGQLGDLGGSQGGCGGCGGNGGLGGSGGGASIALLLSATDATLDSITLVTKDAGIGGSGSTGESGLVGGVGGAAGGSCSGGKGGSGAGGGGGGGGAGGISVGILYQGRAPLVDGQALTDAPTSPFITLGQAGAGGAGGEGGLSGPNGVPGSKGAAGTAGASGIRHAIKSM